MYRARYPLKAVLFSLSHANKYEYEYNRSSNSIGTQHVRQEAENEQSDEAKNGKEVRRWART